MFLNGFVRVKLDSLDLKFTKKGFPQGFIHLVRTQFYFFFFFFEKTNIFYPLISTRTCAYQEVRNISFSENFAYILNE